MARQIGYCVIAFFSAFLFFLAVGYSGWPCAGSILSETCRKTQRYEVTGALLLTAGLVVLVCAIILILVIVLGGGWTDITAAVLATIAAILSIAGVFYFYDAGSQWSPFIATIAMSFSVALAAILLFDLISARLA